MSAPLITIGMTCYNAADSIEAALESALAQDWPNKEIIIVDDCSSDNSIALLQNKIQNIPYAKLIRHEKNAGFAGALNTIIDHAQGEYIAFFDDDDTSYPQRLSEQYNAITDYRKNSGDAPVICYAATEKIYPNGYRASYPAIGSSPKVPQGEDMVRFHLYLKRDPEVFYGSGTPTCSVMASRETFMGFGHYDTNLRRNEDCDFAVRMGQKGAHFIGTKNVLVRQTPSGGTDKRPEVAFLSDTTFLNKYADILKSHGRYDFALAWSKIKYYHYAGRDMAALSVFLKSFLRQPGPHLAHFFRAAPRRFLHELKMKRTLHVAP